MAYSHLLCQSYDDNLNLPMGNGTYEKPALDMNKNPNLNRPDHQHQGVDSTLAAMTTCPKT